LHGSAPHPVACCEPDNPVKGQQVTSDYPSGTTVTSYPVTADRRERCVSPTSATDSRYEHPVDCPIPERTLRGALRPFASCRPAFSQWPRAAPQVELRLTATLQLQRSYNPPNRVVRDLGPVRRHEWDPARSWRNLDRGSSALSLPAAAFSTAHRARSIASDALCRGFPEPNLTARPSEPPGSIFTAVSSKTTASPEPGRLPSTSAPPPHPTFAGERNHRSLSP